MARRDLYIHTDSEGYEPALITSDSENDPVILPCEGMVALGGMVLRMLLSPRGAWPGDRSEGCELAEVVGSVFDKTTLSAIASRSLISIQQTIFDMQNTAAVPPEERLRSLELLQTTVLPEGSAIIRVMVKNYAGESAVLTSGTE